MCCCYLYEWKYYCYDWFDEFWFFDEWFDKDFYDYCKKKKECYDFCEKKKKKNYCFFCKKYRCFCCYCQRLNQKYFDDLCFMNIFIYIFLSGLCCCLDFLLKQIFCFYNLIDGYGSDQSNNDFNSSSMFYYFFLV